MVVTYVRLKWGSIYLIVYWYLKTFRIMANTSLIFYGTDRSSTNRNELEAYLNAFNEIFITIEDDEGCQHICLDKSTAIKFAKTLRTEINKIEEVQNEAH